MPAISLVSDLLRSPDEAKVVLEATLFTASETSQDLQNRRVLAVISHKDDWDLTEEGRYMFLLPNFNFSVITNF
jgi:phosphatidylinositol-bisphosphatase